MFWTFANPIRHIRRFSGRVEYTLLPSRRPSAQSDYDTEKGDAEEGDLEEERRKNGVKALAVLLLLCLSGTALYLQCRARNSTTGQDPVEANASGSEPTPQPETAGQVEDETVTGQVEDETVTRQVVYDTRDPTHVYLSRLSPLPHSRALLSSPPASEAVRSFLETGEIADFSSTPPSTVDVVYLWVNSTDPVFPEAYAERMEQEGLPIDRGQARRWRDNGELRGAMRSSVQSLGESLRKVHVVSADYPERPITADEQGTDVTDLDLESDWLGTSGQIPEWLDWQAQEDGTSDKVNWHFHSDIFRLPRDHRGRLAVDDKVLGDYELISDDLSENLTDSMAEEERLEEAWRELALPSFNSFAIESRVGWVTGLGENL